MVMTGLVVCSLLDNEKKKQDATRNCFILLQKLQLLEERQLMGVIPSMLKNFQSKKGSSLKFPSLVGFVPES
jgi:hypothetical protein